MTKYYLKQAEYCHRIYLTVRAHPFMITHDISVETGISRNTVSRYLRDMIKRQALVGPHLKLKPNVNYPRYVHLTSFSSPQKTFNLFKEFPRVLSYARCFGDWNFLFVTDRLVDFSQLKGHSKTFYWGKRGFIWDVPAQFATWSDTCSVIDDVVKNPGRIEIPQGEPVEIPWTQDQWKIFWRFKDNPRLVATPALKEIRVRYEAFSDWKRSLEHYVQTQVGYYPQGFPYHTKMYFLLETDQPEHVSAVFQCWPTTTLFTQVDNKLLVLLAVPGGKFLSKVLNLFDSLVTENFISSFKHALFVQQWRNSFPHI